MERLVLVTNRYVRLFAVVVVSWAAAAAAQTSMGRAAATTSSSTCTIYWTGDDGTAWSDPANWSLTDGGAASASAPVATDVACMSTAPSSASIEVGSDAMVGAVKFPSSTGDSCGRRNGG